MSGWIGVDLDGTLAQYSGWMGEGAIGSPVPAMVDRIKRWQDSGVEIRIFTARATEYSYYKHALKVRWFDGHRSVLYKEEFLKVYERDIKPIEDWCEQHFGQRFEVTAVKDFAMIELWDDRAIQVEMNTGMRVDGREAGA